MKQVKLPELAKRYGRNPKSQSKLDGANEDPPLCVHGHITPLPLLADFPKKRIDINPFQEDPFGYLKEFNWATREVNISKILRKVRTSTNISKILLFLDSYTVQNLNICGLDGVDAEVFLFLGDTQHGPHEGFHELIRIAQNPIVTKVITSNNPQHLHFFEESGVSPSKLYYCPLGLANTSRHQSLSNALDPAMGRRNISDLLAKKIVFVGTIADTHPRRKYLINRLSSAGYCNILKTANYRDAEFFQRNALASINVSLNRDINFRFSEVIGSGGTLITDRLPYWQTDYINQVFCGAPVHYYNDFRELLQICKDLLANNKQGKEFPAGPRFHQKSDNNYFQLHSLDDLNHFLIPYRNHARKEIEEELFSNFPSTRSSITSEERLKKYLAWRDQAFALDEISEHRSVKIGITEHPLVLMDMTDLGFTSIILENQTNEQRLVAERINSLFKTKLIDTL